MIIEADLPLVDELLGQWQSQIGKDYAGYRNHVYRMLNFCFALHNGSAEERQKLTIAGCFHDLGIWSDDTFDYLPPSIARAQSYLQQNQLAEWIPEIALMIDMHHKIRPYHDTRYPLVEIFRRGDLVDFSLGLVPCGLPRAYIGQVKQRFPNAGFHQRLVQLELSWLPKHLFNPAPVFKW
ncbi:MAG: hypothetical protein KF832_18325 [Caldilineaceae bacterium]|nr:hypothetical protein [Caldilineaceae bacterium]